MMTPEFGCHCLKSGVMTSETCCHARVMTAVTEKMATDARKPEIKEMAENSYFLWCPYGRCYRQMRARYRNFIRTLRMHMKLLAFFF
ncbi:hypothetical protein HK16_00350 [Acetobacter senegalensis]|uniref:Uncharacterized protein n=2 Tax=Acetobacter TaxID=434 RepID=A0A252EEK6_9PROT|nr:hypothetical protein HK16_00350 [Acetobacter senegalensis]